MARCEAFVFEERCQNHQCLRTGSVKRKGKMYCKQHDPVRVEIREKERIRKWERESEARSKVYEQEGKAQADLERKAALCDELAGAIKFALEESVDLIATNEGNRLETALAKYGSQKGR